MIPLIAIRFVLIAYICGIRSLRARVYCIHYLMPMSPTNDEIADAQGAADLLRERDELFRLVVESSPSGILLVDTEGRIELVNVEAERIFGYLRNDLIGMKVEDLMPPEMRKAHEHSRGSYMMGHRERRLGAGRDLVAIRADGTTFPAEIGLTPVKTAHGVKTLVTVVDITGRRRTENALRGSEERLRLALSAARMGLWDWNIADDVLTWSEETLEIFGAEPEDFVGNRAAFLERVHPGDRGHVEMMTQWGLETGNDMTMEFRIVHSSGEVRWVSSRSRVIRGAADRPVRLLGIVMDRTERKLHEEAVLTGEARYRVITENVRDVLMRHGPDGSLLYASPACRELCGYDPAELVEHSLFSIIHPDDRAAVADIFEMEQHGGSANVSFRVVTKSGGIVWVEMTASPLLDAAGRLLEIFSVARDVSERKRYEEELIAAKEKAEEMARLKDALLTNMSHEIRTPLTAIIGFSAILTSETADQVRTMAQLIQSAGERLMMTLESVLDLARLESNSIRLSPMDTDLVTQTEDVLCLFRRQAFDKGLTLNFTHEEGEIPALVDPGAFSRILTNLLANAVKFTPSGGISVSLASSGPEVVVQVADSGVGIGEEFRKRVFEEFTQESEGLSRGFEGVGLGLAITRRLVELMHGAIRIDSEKGRGTTVTINLPIRRPYTNGKHRAAIASAGIA